MLDVESASDARSGSEAEITYDVCNIAAPSGRVPRFVGLLDFLGKAIKVFSEAVVDSLPVVGSRPNGRGLFVLR